MRRLLTLSGHVTRTVRFALPLPAAIVLFLAILLAAASARAELRVDITRGHVEPLPIALVDLAGANEADATLGRQITEVITRNLERSGLFRPIDPAAFIIEPGGMTVRPRFQDWRIINAQALVTGRVVPGDPGRLVVEFRLWDVFAEQDLVGLKLSGAREAWRSIAHTMSDKIYERLTGESGYFHTRIVYIAETGPPDLRIKRLAIMDQDGHNLRYLSDGRHLVLTPRFSPTAQEITYLSYERGVPKVYLRDIDTGQQELLGDFPGMTFAPRFSPDGNQVVMTMAQRGNSDIYEMDLRSRRVRQLTNNPAIETAPCYSPDGAFIAFESDRGGSQQIYVMRPRWERCAPHHVRQGSLRNPGMVSARRPDRLHQQLSWPVCHRCHEARRERRANSGARLLGRRPDLGAERARADVLPVEFAKSRQRRIGLHRSDRAQRAHPVHEHGGVRSGLVAVDPVMTQSYSRTASRRIRRYGGGSASRHARTRHAVLWRLRIEGMFAGHGRDSDGPVTTH